MLASYTIPTFAVVSQLHQVRLMGRAGFAPATKKGRFYRPLPTLIGEPTQVKRRRGQDSNLQWVAPCFLSREVLSAISATSPDSPKEI